MSFFKNDQLAFRITSHERIVKCIWITIVRIVVKICPEQTVLLGKFVIHPGGEKILIHNLWRRKSEFPCIPGSAQPCVRQGIKAEKFRNGGVHRYVSCRENSGPRIC